MPYNEDMEEIKREKKRFTLFCKELATLSMKYDIAIRSVGGVDIYDEDSILKIVYDDDWSTGDLQYSVKTIDN